MAAIARKADLPLIAFLTGYNACIDGCALYAEQLFDQFGLYAGGTSDQTARA